MSKKKRKAYHNGAPTIDELKARGYDVYVHHEKENVIDPDYDPGQLLRSQPPIIGVRVKTTVAFCSPIRERAVGQAVCHPSDNWNRKKGISIALGRAWKAHLQHNIPRPNDVRTDDAQNRTPAGAELLSGAYPTGN